MERQLICDGKFVFGHSTISLPVFIKDLPNKIIFEGNDFLINPFLHVSLVCIGEIIKKHSISISDFETKIVDDFCDFSKNNDVSEVKYSNDFKFAERDDLKTIIVLCEVPNLDKFFELINKKYDLNIEYPPTHVTLYKLPEKKGIFLTDINDIKNLTKPISNPIGYSL